MMARNATATLPWAQLFCKLRVQLTYINIPSVSSDLLVAEREILTRVAAGGSLKDVMRDIILMVEKPSNGEMLASILILSEDG